MADPVFTVKDMVNAAWNSKPTEFADYFSGVMIDKVNDKVDQIRQQVAARIMGQDVDPPSSVELEYDEDEAEADEADNEQDEETDEDTETDSRSE